MVLYKDGVTFKRNGPSISDTGERDEGAILDKDKKGTRTRHTVKKNKKKNWKKKKKETTSFYLREKS